jgi:hypothetical protein
MTQRGVELYLFVNGLMYIVFGLWCAIDPMWTAQAVGFHLPGNQGLAEFVAVYGGLEFGVGAFFILAARSSALRHAGLLFGTCFYLGIFVFRSFQIAQTGFDIGAGLNFYIAEGVFVLWSVWLLRKHRSA